MIDGEPQIGFRAFVKEPNKRIKRSTEHFPPAPSYRQEYYAKLAGAIDLNKEENLIYRESIADIKRSIIQQYSNAGIKLTDEMFPSIVLRRDKKNKENAYYRRENTAVVTVGNQPTLFDLVHIHHELNHGISTTTEVIKPDGGESVYVHTGLTVRNGNGTETGVILEEGLMSHMSLDYLSGSDNKYVNDLRDEHFNMLIDRMVLDKEDYPRNQKERFDIIKGNLTTLPNYRFAHETMLSLLNAADRKGGQSEQDKLMSSLLWARVLPTKKADLIRYIDDITENGIGKKIFTTHFSGDVIHFLNTQIRAAYFGRSRKR